MSQNKNSNEVPHTPEEDKGPLIPREATDGKVSDVKRERNELSPSERARADAMASARQMAGSAFSDLDKQTAKFRQENDSEYLLPTSVVIEEDTLPTSEGILDEVVPTSSGTDSPDEKMRKQAERGQSDLIREVRKMRKQAGETARRNVQAESVVPPEKMREQAERGQRDLERRLQKGRERAGKTTRRNAEAATPIRKPTTVVPLEKPTTVVPLEKRETNDKRHIDFKRRLDAKRWLEKPPEPTSDTSGKEKPPTETETYRRKGEEAKRGARRAYGPNKLPERKTKKTLPVLTKKGEALPKTPPAVAKLKAKDESIEIDRRHELAEQEIAEKLKLDQKKPIIPQIIDAYRQAIIDGDTKTQQIIVSAYAEQFGPEEAQRIVSKFQDEEVQKHVSRIRIAHLVENSDAKIRKKVLAADSAEALDKVFKDEAKNGNTLFKDYLRDTKRSAELHEKAQKFIEMKKEVDSLKSKKKQKLSKETRKILKSLDVNPKQIPPEAQAAVEQIVQDGGALMIKELLENRLAGDGERLEGEIAGQIVALDNSGGLYLIGEKANNTRGAQGRYWIYPPTPAGFEKTLVHATGEQNNMSYIAENSTQAEGIWSIIVGNPNDESFPRENAVNRFRNFLILIIGEGNPEKTEEERRFEELGMVKNGVVDIDRVNDFKRALDQYVPNWRILHEGGDASPNFKYSDALFIAQHLDKKDENDIPRTINDLRALKSEESKKKEG